MSVAEEEVEQVLDLAQIPIEHAASGNRQVVSREVGLSNIEAEYRILMHGAIESKNSRQIIDWLFALDELTPRGSSWTFDLSQVQSLPLWLIGSLCSHAHQLHHRGGSCRLDGIPEGLFTPKQLERLRDIFGATNVNRAGSR